MLTLDQQLTQICSQNSIPAGSSDVIIGVKINQGTQLPKRFQKLVKENNLKFSVPKKIAEAFDAVNRISNAGTRSKTFQKIAEITAQDKLFAISYIVSTVFLSGIETLKTLTGKLIECDQVEDAIGVTNDILQLGGGDTELKAVVDKLIEKERFDRAEQVAQAIQSPVIKFQAFSSIAIGLANRGNVKKALKLERYLQSQAGRIRQEQWFDAQIRPLLAKVVVSIAEAMAKSGDLQGAVQKLTITKNLESIPLILTRSNQVSEAIAFVKQHLQSDICRALAKVACQLIAMGKPAEAIPTVEMINTEPGDCYKKEQALFIIAIAFARAHYFDEAKQVAGMIKHLLGLVNAHIAIEMIQAGKVQEAYEITLKILDLQIRNLAIDFFEKATLAEFSTLSEKGQVDEAYKNIGFLLENVGKYLGLDNPLLTITEQMAYHKEFEKAVELARHIDPSDGQMLKAFLTIVKEQAKVDLVKASKIAQDMYETYKFHSNDVSTAFILIAVQEAMAQGVPQAMDHLRSHIKETFRSFGETLSDWSPALCNSQLTQLINQTMQRASKQIAEELSHTRKFDEAQSVLDSCPRTEDELCEVFSTLAIDVAKGEQST